MQDVLEMNQIEGKQLPEVRDHPEAPQPRDEAPPPVDGLSEDAGQPLGGAEPVGGVRAEPGDGGELGDGGGEIGDKEVERQSEKVAVDEEGVVGVNPPVGVAEEMKEGLVKLHDHFLFLSNHLFSGLCSCPTAHAQNIRKKEVGHRRLRVADFSCSREDENAVGK